MGKGFYNEMNQTTRDMSQREYEKRLAAHGFTTDGFMGYWRKNGISISELNAGPRRRDRLAYILNHYDRLVAYCLKESKA